MAWVVALQKTPLCDSVPLTGVDTKTGRQAGRDHQANRPAERGVHEENSTISKPQRLPRRLGRLVDGTGAPYDNATGIAKRQDELILFADAEALSHRPSTDSWDATGAVSSVVAMGAPTARTGTVQAAADIAVNGGVEVCAWRTTAAVSGARCSSRRVSGSSFCPPFLTRADSARAWSHAATCSM